MATGTLKWFQPETGVGFIEPDGGGQDILIMESSLRPPDPKPLQIGDRLEFEVQDDVAGPTAINVKRFGPSAE